MNRFRKIVGLHLEHDYFEDGVNYPVRFKLAEETKELMGKYGLKVVHLKNSIELYYYSNGSIGDLLDYIRMVTGQGSLCFELASTDENFDLYTEFPVDRLGRLKYNSIHSKMEKDSAFYLLDGGWEEGEFDEFAQVQIDFDQLWSDSEAPDFFIHLKARKTRWNYFIINKSQLDLEGPTITGKSEVEFDGPSTVTLPNGQEALLFSSGKTQLELSERPKYQFSLVDYPNGQDRLGSSQTTRKNLFKALPNPNPAKMEINQEDGTNVVSSPMYVYV